MAGSSRFINFCLDQQNFAANIRAARKGRGISQAAVGKILGVSKPTISVWESAKGLPTIDHFLALCWLFEFQPISFLLINTEQAVKTARMFAASVGDKPIATVHEVFVNEPIINIPVKEG